nr:MAG TPA: hypothetical protein [Caudoviricetes sp.]
MKYKGVEDMKIFRLLRLLRIRKSIERGYVKLWLS